MSGQPKVYKTSVGYLEPTRDAKYVASSLTIEVLHIAVIFGLIAFVFGGIWKAASLRQKKAAGSLAGEASRS